jgi:hypothetical protein
MTARPVARWADWRRCGVAWVALLRHAFGPRRTQHG